MPPSAADPVPRVVRGPSQTCEEADTLNLTGCPMEVSYDVNDVDESCLDGEMEEARTNRKKLNMKPFDLTTAR